MDAARNLTAGASLIALTCIVGAFSIPTFEMGYPYGRDRSPISPDGTPGTEVHHADQVWVNTHGDVAMGEPGVDPVWQPRPEPTEEPIEEEVDA